MSLVGIYRWGATAVAVCAARVAHRAGDGLAEAHTEFLDGRIAVEGKGAEHMTRLSVLSCVGIVGLHKRR